MTWGEFRSRWGETGLGGVRHDRSGHVEDRGQQIGCQYLDRRAVGGDPTVGDHSDGIEMAEDEVEVVHRGDDRRLEVVEDLHQPQSPGRVEVVRRLVEYEDRRLLRDRAGEHDTVPFAARELHTRPAFPASQSHLLQCGPDDLLVVGIASGPRRIGRACVPGPPPLRP